MFTVVIGGSGSGKSSYAESLLDSFAGKKYYLATMQIGDAETMRRVERHRENRSGKGFETIERCRDIGNLASERFEAPREESKWPRTGAAGGLIRRTETWRSGALLLECMSNLVANEMFLPDRMRPAEEVVEKVVADTLTVAERVCEMVVVTNNVFEDGCGYGAATAEYLCALAEINRRLAGTADRVVEVVAGLAVVCKETGSGV